MRRVIAILAVASTVPLGAIACNDESTMVCAEGTNAIFVPRDIAEAATPPACEDVCRPPLGAELAACQELPPNAAASAADSGDDAGSTGRAQRRVTYYCEYARADRFCHFE